MNIYYNPGLILSSATFNFNTFTFAGPKSPKRGHSMDFSTRFATKCSSRCLAAATLFTCTRADSAVMSGSSPEPLAVTISAGTSSRLR